MITWSKRLLLTASFPALITTNILTLTSTAFNAALSGLMGTALGIRAVSSMMQYTVSVILSCLMPGKFGVGWFITLVSS